jgi:hypothetical protein
MARRRRNDPWSRLRRALSDDGRRDLQLALSVGQLLDDGHERAQVLSLLGLTEGDARDLARRIRDATRSARIQLEPASRLAEILAAIDGDGAR